MKKNQRIKSKFKIGDLATTNYIENESYIVRKVIDIWPKRTYYSTEAFPYSFIIYLDEGEPCLCCGRPGKKLPPLLEVFCHKVNKKESKV